MMKVTAKTITVEPEDAGKGASFLYDLSIIMPLMRATLTLSGEESFSVFVGKDGKSAKAGKTDITDLCAEGDILVLSFPEREIPPVFSAEVHLCFAGGIEKTIVTDESWLYGDFEVKSNMTQNLAEYIFETVPKINKKVIIE